MDSVRRGAGAAFAGARADQFALDLGKLRAYNRCGPICRDADVIRTDHHRALGALGRKAPEGKKDPSQKKEGGKG